MEFNKLLLKQIKKYLPDANLEDVEFKQFIKSVNDSYNSYERDKELANHVFNISEQEYIDVNKKLKTEIDEKEISIENLKDAIKEIEGPNTIFSSTSKESLPEIIAYLKKQIEKNKESEKIIKLSEFRMRHALETIGDNVWEYDTTEGKIYFSQCENLLLGYESDDYKADSKLWWKCILKEDRIKIKNRNELYRSGLLETHSIEYRLKHRDGSIKWMMDRGGVIEKSNDGKPLRIIGTLTDITHLKQVEDDLITSGNRLSHLISNLQEGVLVSDAAGKIVLANSIFCQLFHVKDNAESLIGTEILTGANLGKYLFKDAAGFVATMTELIQNREIFVGYELKLVDNRVYQCDYIPLFVDGENSGHLLKFKDITKERLAQSALQLREEKYRNIIANMNLGLIEVDLNENIQFANQSFSDLSGYSISELMGMNSENILPKASELSNAKKIEIQNNSQADAYELKITTKLGTQKWCLVSGAPKYNDKGEWVGSIGIHLDISAQKKLEKDLIEAREMAEHSAQAKEIFLANMSHEVRTPMNAILGMSKQLQKTTLTEKQNSLLNIINSASENLLVVINDILDLSKIEAGKLTIENIGFNLHEVVSRAMQVISHRAEEKGLRLMVDFDTNISTTLIGDPYRTNQILLNLLSNAVKFTARGYVKIECQLSKTYSTKNQTILISVIDSGIGMDEEFQTQLFQKFVQEDKSVARKYGGTGLGMSICKQLIELMGGKINVKSKKDIGTTIEVELMFELGSQADVPVVNPIVANHEILRNKNILLVEDNEMNRLVACEALSHYGLHITEAINGLEAVELIKNKKFDIILMDVQMPVMNGFEATEMIRKVFKNDTPIIALTANALKGESVKCLAAGMDDYISKPFEEDDLVNMMATWILKKNNQLLKNETSPNASLNPPIYNLTHLERISRGNQEFIIKMKQLFIAQIPSSMNEIRLAFDDKNFPLLKKTAHKIKPIVQNLGINDLVNDLSEIESLAHEDADNSELSLIIERASFVLNQAVEQMKIDIN
jgi:two-component system, sensor histidine kinase